MATPHLPARQRNASPAPSAPKLTLGNISSAGPGLPNRLILHATEGWGKTSFGAMAPGAVFVQARGETGLGTLIDANQVPATPHFPAAPDWTEFLAAIDVLLNEQHQYRTLVIDTINGAERLCHEYVCETEYGGQWGDSGFMAYHKGFETSLSPWREMLSRLDRLRTERRMSIILLCHTAVKNFKNPEGSDYDRYQTKMHDKTWALTKEWADIVLFGHYRTLTVGKGGREETDPTKRAKAIGGEERILLTQRTAAYDAKNRLGLPAEIECGYSAAETWKNFVDAAKAAKEAAKNG
jgi:hypothetical protein